MELTFQAYSAVFGAHNAVTVGGIAGVPASDGVAVGVGVGVSPAVAVGDGGEVATKVAVADGDEFGLDDEVPGDAEHAASRKTVPPQTVANRAEVFICVITPWNSAQNGGVTSTGANAAEGKCVATESSLDNPGPGAYSR